MTAHGEKTLPPPNRKATEVLFSERPDISDANSAICRRLPNVFRGRRAFLFGACLSLAGTIGCAGYQLGNATLYNPNIRTVYVPIVRNETFRHEVGVQLTEAIQKTIEQRTPYKVVGDPSADSVLTCRITTQRKRVVVETVTDEARNVETMMSVELTWTDRRGNLLMENRFVPAGELAFYFVQSADFVPEGGQSMATAQLQAIERLANQVVSEMEVRW